VGRGGRGIYVDVRPLRSLGGLAVRSASAQDAGAGWTDCVVAGYGVDGGLSHLWPTGPLPRAQWIGRGGLSPSFDVPHWRLSRSEYTLSRHVSSSVERLCGVD